METDTRRAIEQVETAWEDAHEKLRIAFEERERLGAAFWARLLELEVTAYSLGRQLDELYRAHRPQLRPSAENNPRAVTAQEHPAVVLPFVKDGDV